MNKPLSSAVCGLGTHSTDNAVNHSSANTALPAAWCEALFEHHPHAVVVTDAAGQVQRINSAAHGFDFATLQASMPLPPALKEALKTGCMWKGLLSMKTPDGPVQTFAANVLPSSDSAMVLWVFDAASEARSDAFVATAAVHDSDVPFKAAADQAPVMMWMTSQDSTGEWFNRPWRAYTGHALPALLGHGWLNDVHPEDVERCMGIYATSYADRQPFSMDYRLRRHDGTYRWILVNGVPRFRGEDKLFQGYVGVGIDIHERKALEEKLAEHTQALRLADRRQNQFIAMLSHELRGPLAPISNAASVLRALESDNPTLMRLREIIERQVGRMRRLVDDLVDVTRVMQGQITVVKQPVAIADLLRSAVESSQAKLDAGGHRLQIDQSQAQGADPLLVLGDSVRLSQALSHLLSNAAKFTRVPSDIQVKVSLSHGFVSISVRDNGPGISTEFLPHVFDLFSQQEDPRSRVVGGLGLGLPLARRVARLHGGDVKAFSAGQDQGAEFVFSLPLMNNTADVEPTGSDRPLSAQPSAPCRVLLVEENPDTRYLLKLQIELWGNEVTTASHAEEALRLAESFQPDIVLCDLALSNLNGPQLMREMGSRLRMARPLFAALAGHGRHEDEAIAKAEGYDAFLVKPLRPESLSQLFRSCASRTA